MGAWPAELVGIAEPARRRARARSPINTIADKSTPLELRNSEVRVDCRECAVAIKVVGADDTQVPIRLNLSYNAFLIGVARKTGHLTENYAVSIVAAVALCTTYDTCIPGAEYPSAHPRIPRISDDWIERVPNPVLSKRVLGVEYVKLGQVLLPDTTYVRKHPPNSIVLK